MTYSPLIKTQADLEDAWRTLIEPLPRGEHTLFLMLIDAEGRPVPRLIEMTDSETPPDEETFSAFGNLVRELIGHLVPGGRIAFLLSRPGAGTLTATDRAWAVGLYGAAREADVPAETVHLAAGDVLLPIPLDELDLPRSA